MKLFYPYQQSSQHTMGETMKSKDKALVLNVKLIVHTEGENKQKQM